MDEKYYFGNKLYELRTGKGLTQKELGKLLGVSNKAVSKWETGEAKPRLDTVNKLSAILGVSVSELLGDEAEATESTADRQLESYSNYFSEQSKKLDARFKLVKGLIIAISIGLLITFLVDYIYGMIRGSTSGSVVSISLMFVVIVPYILFSLHYIQNQCYGERLSKNQIISNILLYLGISSIVLAAIEYLFCYIDYRFFDEELPSKEEYIIPAICAVCLIMYGYFFRKNIKDIQKHSSVFHIDIMIVVFLLGVVLSEKDIVAFVALLLFAVRSACKKLDWIELAQKVNDNYAEEKQPISKRRTIVVVSIITGMAIVLGAVSFLLAPYIGYKTVYSDLPDYLKQPVEEYKHYDLHFKENESQTVEFENISFQCPTEWKIEFYEDKPVAEDDYVYKNAKYSNKENGVFILVTSEDNKSDMFEYVNDESDDLDEETRTEIKRMQKRIKKYDRLFIKYFGIPYNMNIYQSKYLMYRIDFRDVKWYQTEKLAVYVTALIIKSLSPPMAINPIFFEEDDKCGFVTNIYNSYNAFQISVFEGDGTNADKYYQFLLRFDNLSEQESVELMSKILNSIEFVS